MILFQQYRYDLRVLATIQLSFLHLFLHQQTLGFAGLNDSYCIVAWVTRCLKVLTPFVSVCFRMLSELSEWFWQERRWFPEGLGWADLEDRDGRVYAKARDLWVALPIALIFLIIRQIFERSVHFSLCLILSQTFTFNAFMHFFMSLISPDFVFS